MEGDWKLIHYHEDGRDELYHLGKDIGEQNNLITKQSKLAQQMRGKLDEWLKQTNAKFPKPDAKFDAKRETRWKNIKTSEKKDSRSNMHPSSHLITSPIRIGGEAHLNETSNIFTISRFIYDRQPIGRQRSTSS